MKRSWHGCGAPKRKRTARGMRCAQVCSSGKLRFVENSKCDLQTQRERQSLGCGCGAAS